MVVIYCRRKTSRRLCLWHTIEDDLLDRVFLNIVQDEACDEKTKLTIRNAKHLVRWCLKGDASERPSVDAILKHPFLSDDTVVKQFHSEDDTHFRTNLRTAISAVCL